MSDDSNPYAPPSVAEPEVQSTRYWYLQGIDLLAKSGATLPKVDLDTGVREGPMKGVPRVVKVTNPADIFKGLAVFGAYLLVRSYLNLEKFGFLIPFLILLFLAKRLGLLRENPKSVVRVWTFIEERRARKSTLRRRLRIGIMILVSVAIIVWPFSVGSVSSEFLTWFQWILPGGVLCIIALAIWGALDRPKTKTLAESPGWLRFSRIHPAALAFLRAEEEHLNLRDAGLPALRQRLVRTVFYHRYPLRLLIGHRIFNPFAILQVTLMKLLRSKLLVRAAYHFSEATEVPIQNLCPPLRQAAESWLADHPDWSFVTADHLTSPAGDLTVENAVLASPGLEHCAAITRAWMEQRPEKGITQFRFITWLTDGNPVSTHDQPYLVLANPHLHHRASGKPERIYQAHLRNIGALTVSPARDIPELLARLLHEKEETDRLLTEKGLQSGVATSESP